MKFDNLYINYKKTIRDAIIVIDKGALKTVFVVDDEEKLLGVVSDGDIRRYLIKSNQQDICITQIMNNTPLTGDINRSRSEHVSIMQANDLSCLPIVDKKNAIKKIEILRLGHLVRLPVLIMAGGFGKRLYPLTKDTPKPMLNINGKPLLHRTLSSLIEQGFREFYISVHYKKDKIIDYFGNGEKFGVKIFYIHEDSPLGTAGAISLMEISGSYKNLLVVNGDVVSDLDFVDLVSYHNLNDNDLTVCARKFSYEVPFGVINSNGNELDSIQEKPIYNYDICAGIYILDPKIVKIVNEVKKMDMPDLIHKVRNNNFKVGIYSLDGYWRDIGHIDDFEEHKSKLQKLENE